MNRATRAALALVLGLALAPGARAVPPVVAQVEIDYLLDKVAGSGCEFSRNGIWYDGARAVGHLQYKYADLVASNLIATAEDFIERAATRSTVSGKSYLIRCKGAEPIASAQWFLEQLAGFREARRPMMDYQRR